MDDAIAGLGLRTLRRGGGDAYLAVVSATREGLEAEGAADSFVDLAQRAPDPLQQLDDRLLRLLHGGVLLILATLSSAMIRACRILRSSFSMIAIPSAQLSALVTVVHCLFFSRASPEPRCNLPRTRQAHDDTPSRVARRVLLRALIV